MKVRFFDPGLSYLKIKPEIDTEMQSVLETGDLILREDVDRFEENFAKYVGTKYAVTVASGTDALILSLVAAGIQRGDKVLAPSYSFRATIEAIVHAGGVPVLYDIDGKVSFDEDIKYWIPAYIAGEYPDLMPEVIERANKLGVTVIEDACQAIGAAPVRGLTACYSFYPAKILGCYGDGGAIATNEQWIYEMLLKMRNHWKGDWGPVGYNSRLDNIQAAVLNIKLGYLPDEILSRKHTAMMYDTHLNEFGIKIPTIRAVYQDYIIELGSELERDALQKYLAEQGVETMANGYPYPMAYPKGPLTLAYEAKTLRLPCNSNLTDEEIVYVINSIHDYFTK